jgi:hypothetical protein
MLPDLREIIYDLQELEHLRSGEYRRKEMSLGNPSLNDRLQSVHPLFVIRVSM